MVLVAGAGSPPNTLSGGLVNDTRAEPRQPEPPRRPTVCRFFNQPQGCRFGSDCRFLHIATTTAQEPNQPNNPDQPARSSSNPTRSRGRGRGRGAKGRGRQSDSLRKRQIDELLKVPQWTVKRLSSERGESAFAVEMKPSDPDFPFDVSRLYLALVVPSQYPTKRTSDPIAAIQVANQNIPVGVKRNIELAFAKHVRQTSNAAIEQEDPENVPTLEEYLVWLDQNLELLMQQKPAPTIKFTSFVGPKLSAESKSSAEPSQAADASNEGTVIRLDIVPTDPEIHDHDIFKMTGTLTIAQSYPEPDGHTSPVSLSLDADSIIGRKDKPSAWQPVGGRLRYLDYICRQFAEHVAELPSSSLLQHLNWLDRRLVGMIASPPPVQPALQPVAATTNPEGRPQTELFAEPEAKPWIRQITPAEAGMYADMAALNVDLPSNGTGSSDSDFDSTSSDGDDDAAEQSDADSGTGPFAKPARRGIEIRLGMVKLAGVSLAHCHSLNLNVRCTRCKSLAEVKGIAPTVKADRDHQMWKACDTCSTILGVRFRPDWMFGDTTTLGYLDCSGCTPVDLLPSKLTLACDACAMNDNETNTPDTVGTVGIAANAQFSCRRCFARMSVLLQEPQFVQLQAGVKLGGRSGAAQISKEVERSRRNKVSRREELARLGVVPGQPLPSNGACKHFRRSNRWMRFPCCGKTYPCVTCHDDQEDHDHEYAQSMLCGFCAKEQRISRAEQTGTCVSCGAHVIKKVDGNNAFWQGGKGVRDRTRMSRKDTKKFQGLGKTIAQKKVATPKK
ncbi:hypothetical protein LPJ63_003750 [Coemansia sp. RSA 2711]|nr:hypothetical protein LPJ63_003750 [Coemansia sp. RSA 2711]